MSSTSNDLSPEDIETVHIFSNVTAAFSISALAIFFIINLCCSKEKMNFSLKLICNLFFADLLYTLSNLLANIPPTFGLCCQFQAALRTFSLWTSIIWASLIGYVAYVKTVENKYRIELKYGQMALFAYGLPFLISILPFFPFPVSYGNIGPVCWFVNQDGKDSTQIQSLMFLFWAWIAVATTAYYYVNVFVYLKRLELTIQAIKIKRVLIFPIILFSAFLPMTIIALGLFQNYHFQIKIWHNLALHSLGLCNVLAYGYQRMTGCCLSTNSNQEVLENDTSDDSDEEDTPQRDDSLLIDDRSLIADNYFMSNSLKRGLLDARNIEP